MDKLELFIKKYYKYLVIVSILLGIIFLFISFDYLFIFKKIFLYILIALLSIDIIGLILLYVYKEFNNKIDGIIGSIFTIISFIFILVISIILLKINISFSKAYIDDSYYDETIYISYYSKNYSYDDISDLKDVELKVGVIKNKDEGYLGKNSLNDLFNNYKVVEYEDDFSLFKALVDDSSINIGVFSKSYKYAVNGNEDYSYRKYLDDVLDLYSFDEEIKDNKESLENSSFNILLIGFAPENEEGTLGFADSIMLASVNLETLSIDLTSIPRSSDVRYACKGNIRDRINETILDSEKCLIDTSADLLDTEIDYYIEINFNGLVDIVNAIGGISIDNDVEFTGQTSSYLRGEEAIWVPAGTNVWVDGEQALAFARERHSYSTSDDLTRQSNQRQVISRIIEKIMEKGNIYQILKIIDVIGDNVKTNISKDQIINIINKVLMKNDYAGIALFNKLNIAYRQLIGEYVDSYIYYLNSPMSVYELYDKSINEAHEKIVSTLARYTNEDIKQSAYMYFSYEFPYFDKGQDFDFSNETLNVTVPNYYPILIGESLDYALSWANDNNVTLNIEYIKSGDELYDKDKIGEIIYQSVSYGNLVDEYDNCTVKVVSDK